MSNLFAFIVQSCQLNVSTLKKLILMNTEMKPRLLNIGLTLLAIVMLASCSKKPEESASSTSPTPSAIEQTPSSGNAATSTPPKAK